jgi:hypothetical protein
LLVQRKDQIGIVHLWVFESRIEREISSIFHRARVDENNGRY